MTGVYGSPAAKAPKVYDCSKGTHPWEYVGYAPESHMFEGTAVIKGSEVYRCPKCGAVHTG